VSRPSRTRETWPLAGVLLLAAVLRLANLEARGFWRDEAVTIELLRLPLAELLRTIPESEGTPPLYYMLAWFWTRIVGDGEVGARSFSALVGIVAVAVVYLAARELSGRRAALVASLLAAASPLLVWHAQDARAYSLLVLLSSTSFLFFARLLRAPSRGNAFAWAVSSGVALLTHYFAVFLLAPQAAWLLLARRTRRAALAPVTSVLLVGLSLVPIALAQRTNVDWISHVPLRRRIFEVAGEFLVGPQPPRERTSIAITGALVLVALGLLAFLSRPAERRAVAPAAVVGGAALVLPLLLVPAGFDYVLARNLIVALPALMIVAATGLALSHISRIGAVIAGTLAVIGVVVVVWSAEDPKFGAEDWRGAAVALGPPPDGGRAIVLWPRVGVRPFVLYRPSAQFMAAVGAPVSEIVFVALGSEHRLTVERYGGALYPPTPPFGVTSDHSAPYFTIVHLQANRRVFVTPRQLAATAATAPQAAVLLEEPTQRPPARRR